MNESERKTIEHSHPPQHPLWLSVLLSLFPGLALGAFIVGISPVLKGWGLDPIFALFGGIGLVIVPLELGCLAIVAYLHEKWRPDGLDLSGLSSQHDRP